MTTHVTKALVRNREGVLRELQILRHTHPDPRRQSQEVHEEFLLDGAPVERTSEGYRVISTGEVLRRTANAD